MQKKCKVQKLSDAPKTFLIATVFYHASCVKVSGPAWQILEKLSKICYNKRGIIWVFVCVCVCMSKRVGERPLAKICKGSRVLLVVVRWGGKEQKKS